MQLASGCTGSCTSHGTVIKNVWKPVSTTKEKRYLWLFIYNSFFFLTIVRLELTKLFFFSELLDINSQLQVIKSELQDIKLQSWEIMSQLRNINGQFWLSFSSCNCEFTVYLAILTFSSQFWLIFSELWDINLQLQVIKCSSEEKRLLPYICTFFFNVEVSWCSDDLCYPLRLCYLPLKR